MPDIEQLTTNVFKVVVGKFPRRIRVRYYRGDSFSVTLVGENVDGTPFNFGLADSFLTQFRAGSKRSQNIVAELENENHVLGQSDAAIAYDAAQGNPAGTTQDELHLTDETGDKFLTNIPKLLFDTEMRFGDDPTTLVDGELNIEYDITRTRL